MANPFEGGPKLYDESPEEQAAKEKLAQEGEKILRSNEPREGETPQEVGIRAEKERIGRVVEGAPDRMASIIKDALEGFHKGFINRNSAINIINGEIGRILDSIEEGRKEEERIKRLI